MILENFKPMKAKQLTRSSSVSDGIISIVLSAKNGKRLELSKKIIEELDVTDRVHIVNNGESILISKKPIVEQSSEYVLKEYSSGRKVVYCAELVAEIAKILDLNFDSCVCRTITEAKYLTEEGTNTKYAVISKEDKEVI